MLVGWTYVPLNEMVHLNRCWISLKFGLFVYLTTFMCMNVFFLYIQFVLYWLVCPACPSHFCCGLSCTEGVCGSNNKAEAICSYFIEEPSLKPVCQKFCLIRRNCFVLKGSVNLWKSVVSKTGLRKRLQDNCFLTCRQDVCCKHRIKVSILECWFG